MKKYRSFVVLFLISVPAVAAVLEHKVRAGETLSHIAVRFIHGPKSVYGYGGKLPVLIKNNPQIKNPDVIRPGDIVYLTEQEQTLAAAPIKTSAAAAVPSEAEAPSNEMASMGPAMAAKNDHEKKILEPYFDLALMYRQIDAEDRINQTNAKFASELSPQINLGLRHHLDPSLRIALSVSLRTNQFVSPQSGQQLEQPSPSTGLRVEVEKLFAPGTSAALRAGVVQKLFSRASSVSSYYFDKAQVGYYGAAFDWSFMERREFFIGLGASFDMLQAATVNSVSVNSGTDYEVSLFLKKNFSSWSLTERLFYGVGDQSSDLVKQSERRVGLILGAGYVF